MAAVNAYEAIANVCRAASKQSVEFLGENGAVLFDHFNKKAKKPITEAGFEIPLLTRRPGGFQAYSQANNSFRAGVAIATDKMRVYPTWVNMVQSINGATLDQLKSGDANTFIDLARLIKEWSDAMGKRMNYWSHGDGSGALGVVANAALNANGSKTLTCHSLASAAVGEAETKGVKRLDVGHVYHVVDADGSGTINSIITVDAILSATTATVTVSSYANTSASGDFIVDPGQSTTVSSYKQAPQGLRSACAASGIFQNIDRADYPELKTPRVNGGDNPITPYVFRQAKDLVRVARNDQGEGSGKLTIITPGQHGALCNQQFGYRRYDGNETVRGVASKYQDADGDMMLIDPDGAEDRIYIINDSSYQFAEARPLGFLMDDSLKFRQPAGLNSVGKDEVFGVMAWGGNFIRNEGSGQRDAVIDRLSQTDVVQQVSLA